MSRVLRHSKTEVFLVGAAGSPDVRKKVDDSSNVLENLSLTLAWFRSYYNGFAGISVYLIPLLVCVVSAFQKSFSDGSRLLLLLSS